MLQQLSSGRSRRVGWTLGALMLLAMVPIQLVAQAPSSAPVHVQAAATFMSTPETVILTSKNPPVLLRVTPESSRAAAPRQQTPTRGSLLQDSPTPPQSEPTDLPKESTEELLRQQLLEAHKALRASQSDEQDKLREVERRLELAKKASDAAKADREKLLQAEIEAVRKNFAARQVDVENQKALTAERQLQNAANQQKILAIQLDTLRRNIEQVAKQLEEMRQMEKRLREQLKAPL